MSSTDARGGGEVADVIEPRSRDLGDGFFVRRALPSIQRRSIGPFVFFDQMGPADFRAGAGLDVRPHPHIGLATVTYLFSGEILHRDSLGTRQLIRPGEVNWMIAGRGIVHSERTPLPRAHSSSLSGIQAWIGLPQHEEESPPRFTHHDERSLPQLDHAGVQLRLIAGTLYGLRSPVETLSTMFYADARLQPGAALTLDSEHAERALYVYEGALEIERQPFAAGRLLMLRSGQRVQALSREGARLLLIGGAPLDGARQVWWNFVSSSTERIQRAAEQWRSGGFAPVPDDDEFIPLPDTPPPRVHTPEPPRPVNYP
jgi:redox-sensitive bicupin YhaK (pirin superfamily)